MPSAIRNSRRTPRIPVRLSVEVAHRDELWTTETLDVSASGCAVVVVRPLVAHAAVRLVLRSELVRDPLRVQGSVAWVAEQRAGIAFERRRLLRRAGPEAWVKQLVSALPQLSAAQQRLPQELIVDTPVYLAQPRRARMTFTPDEATLLSTARHGIRIEALLEAAQLGPERAARALFSLLERRVLTLSLGEAGDAWRWKAILDPSSAAAPPPVDPLGTFGRGARQRARAYEPATPPVLANAAAHASPTSEGARSLAPPLPPVAQTLAGAEPASAPRAPARSPLVQQQIDAARAALREGRERDAVKLLRSVQVVAPEDAEVAQLLGDLTSRARLRG